jgi:hypothetical protein
VGQLSWAAPVVDGLFHPPYWRSLFTVIVWRDHAGPDHQEHQRVWVDRVVGLEGVRVDIAMLETSDGADGSN